ncbi:MAG: hypothetical protein QXK80_01700 [Candidatus Pacearchaeota archaeon]
MKLENIIFKIYEFFSNRQPPELRCPKCDCATIYYKKTIRTRKTEIAVDIDIYECRRCKYKIELEK